MKTVWLAAACIATLAALAVAINSAVLIGIDTSVAEWFAARRIRSRDAEAAGVFGYIGRPVHVLIPALVCGGLLSLWARSVTPVVLVAGAVGVGVVVEATLKATVGRTVTAGPLVDYTHSFPSGHVTGTAALFGTIAVCLGSRAFALVAAGAVVLVAYLALYTGAHTCTDVIGGMALGGAIVALGAAFLGASVQPALDPGEHRRHAA